MSCYVQHVRTKNIDVDQISLSESGHLPGYPLTDVHTHDQDGHELAEVPGIARVLTTLSYEIECEFVRRPNTQAGRCTLMLRSLPVLSAALRMGTRY